MMRATIEVRGDMPRITLGNEWHGETAQIHLMPTYRPDDGSTIDGTLTGAHPYAYCMLYDRAFAHIRHHAQDDDDTSYWRYIGGWHCGPNDTLGWMVDRIAPHID